MHFSELYEYANGLDEPFVQLDLLVKRIIAHHPHIGDVNYYPVDVNPDIMIAHMLYERDRSSPYEEDFTVANIRYWQGLDHPPYWLRRWVCCKELMHVFDTADEKTNTRERFVQLLDELTSNRILEDASPMFASEGEAMWMALAVLCPAKLRAQHRPRWIAREVTDYDVALALKLPEALVPSIMSDYYDVALERLLKKDCHK
ncbi:MAG: hypothetical protein EON91_12050 [Brevundimonas sp.]|uniref:hypothetical protein n=1 Tax=Brevundimonas sp. TaxID=1871086 RepID=UPI001225F889|nr:hypothetical protein [Brevundimonas sp.]RZJ16710.1 MAG: hypothetical protein EON91_12050 [Brevundimonas sp.]